ncbi:Uncharacterised protein [Bordetella ansorpii]|uniref:Integron gene cassette protein n=1 Tax=Bordetella ansorpii TaxID=288768 RepID=A0A157SCF0_9BORD|nr:hypothetical protein [Bordetella ansorpii]SAI68049.1 Uncharacterised protein [Bordetella ansorpii]
MTLQQRDGYSYGTTRDDLRWVISDFAEDNGYAADQCASSTCACGQQVFLLETNEAEGVAQRTCCACGAIHLMGDSAEYAGDHVPLDSHVCICEQGRFEIESAVALYSESNDVRWLYIGCRCSDCSLVGVFASWKCEGGDADAFLANV